MASKPKTAVTTATITSMRKTLKAHAGDDNALTYAMYAGNFADSLMCAVEELRDTLREVLDHVEFAVCLDEDLFVRAHALVDEPTQPA